jgi:hypothetical protein
MHGGEVQSVLRCGQCNKPFDKGGSSRDDPLSYVPRRLNFRVLASTLKRHGYYCRSRNGTSLSRTRACRSCASRKARCDTLRPHCSRCLARGLDCSYAASRPDALTSDCHEQSPDDLPLSTVSESIDGHLDHSMQSTTGNTSYAADPSVESILATDSSDPGQIVDLVEADFDFSSFVDWIPAKDVSLTTQPKSTSVAPALSLPPLNTAARLWVPSLLGTPTATPRTLVRRSGRTPGAQRIAALMASTLKSYPLMIMEYGKLPPFLHPSTTSLPDLEIEPLLNCISLLRMIRDQTKSDRKLFWRNVRTECEFACQQVRSSHSDSRGCRR